MEIISYVRQQPKAKFSLPKFTTFDFDTKKKNKIRVSKPMYNQNYNSVIYQNYTPELKAYSVTKVRTAITPRTVLMRIGRGVSDTGIFISKNYKKILLGLLIISVTGALSFGAVKVVSHSKNFTGPLKMQTSDCLDIEHLNALMATFALEGVAEYDEQGKLVDADAPVNLYKYTQPVTYQNYKVQNGDTISGITKKFGLTNISTLISVNDIGNVRQLAAGQKLKIPSIDGIVYSVKAGDSLEKITKAYNVSLNTLLDVNELNSEVLTAGQLLFLPGVSLDSKTLKTAMGDKFIMPISAKFRWSSPYGKRIDPIAGVSSFHTGTDMACPTGTPILAAMSGKISNTGTNRVYGNYVIIDHGNGYQTLYAHMSKIIATKGQWVSQGTRIGLVGSTGYSTGPHLHFTVYKNGKMVDPMSVLK